MVRPAGWLVAVLGLLALGLALIVSAAPAHSLGVQPPEADRVPVVRPASTRLATGGGERSLHVNANELPGQAATIAAAGTAWVRIEFRREPGGAVDLAKYGAVVDSLRSNGMAAIGLVDYMTLPQDLDGDGLRDYDDPEDYLAYQDAFTQTLQSLATYFQGRIVHWEIWNEENGGTWHVPAEYYARLLVKSAAVLKAVDPHNQVLFGGIERAWVTSHYLEPVYDALDADWGGARPFDILAMHPYFRTPGGIPLLDPTLYLWDSGDPPHTILDPYLDAMAARGDSDVDIWITEIGWNSALDNPAIEVEGCEWLKVVSVDKATQAQYLHDGLDILLGKVEDPEGNRNRVKTVVWYQYHDTSSGAAALALKMGLEPSRLALDPQAICPADWGLVDGNRQPKPSYWAYQNYTRPVTDVTVLSFVATPRPVAVELAWETGAEVGLAGFLLYRVDEAGGAPVRLLAQPIPAGVSGRAAYDYLDSAVELSTTYTYTLVAIVDGSPATTFGAASAAPDPPPPPPALVATNNSPVVLGSPATLTATLTSSAGVTFTKAAAVTFTWAFGDGQRGDGAVVTHTYAAADVYTAWVTATVKVTNPVPTIPVTIALPLAELTATTQVTVTQPPRWRYLPLVMRGRATDVILNEPVE